MGGKGCIPHPHPVFTKHPVTTFSSTPCFPSNTIDGWVPSPASSWRKTLHRSVHSTETEKEWNKHQPSDSRWICSVITRNGRLLTLINKAFYCCADFRFLVYAQSSVGGADECGARLCVLSDRAWTNLRLHLLLLASRWSEFYLVTRVLSHKRSGKLQRTFNGEEKQRKVALLLINVWIIILFSILVHTWCCRETVLSFLWSCADLGCAARSPAPCFCSL